MDKKASPADVESVFIDAPDHPGAEKLWRYWQSKCRDGRIPDRADINLGEIAEIAPNIMIAEPSGGRGDFRLRLVGSAVSELTGDERTGLHPSEFGGMITEVSRARWLAVTGRVMETGKPAFVSTVGSGPQKSHLRYHAVSLPLTNGSSDVAQVIGCLYTSYVSQEKK